MTDAFLLFKSFTPYALRFCEFVYAPGKLTLQVCGLVLMNNALFSKAVNERSNFRHFFARCFRFFDGFQVANRIPCCFAIIAVAIPAFGSFSNIFFRCAMIGHEFRILDGKGRKTRQILKNNPEVSFADICNAINVKK
jgi:hypothetical protein